MAVAQKTLGMPLYKYDVFVAVTGGIRIEDTGADLAVVGAMYSSYRNEPIKKSKIKNQNLDQNSKIFGLVLCGEVSLLGEVKKVRGWERREREAKALKKELLCINSIREIRDKN